MIVMVRIRFRRGSWLVEAGITLGNDMIGRPD
jgi:hypothetical protein